MSKGFFSEIGIQEGVLIADTVGLVLLGVWSLSNFRDQKDQIKHLSERVKALEDRSVKTEARLTSVKKLDTATRDNVNKIKGHSTRIAQLEQALEDLGNNTIEGEEEPKSQRLTIMGRDPRKSRREKRPAVKLPPPRASTSSSGSESDCALSSGDNSDDIFG